METRISTNKDKNKLKELWDNSFNYTTQFSEWYFKNVFVPENTILITDSSNPISSVSIIPQTLIVSGKEISTAYIPGIATPPEYRSEETTRACISAAVSRAQEEYILSIAIPSDYRFYEKYGWRVAYGYKQYDISPSDLPEYQIRGSLVRTNKIADTPVSVLSDIYTEFTASQNAYAKRNLENWQLILEDLFYNFGGKCVIFKDQNDTPSGYMLYIIRGKKMGVYELAYKDRTAYEGLTGFINAHKTDIDSVSIKAAADDLSYLDFCDCRDAVHLYPFAAARILNAKKALELISDSVSGEFKLQIVDRIIEDNNKTFLVSQGNISETEESADVTTDIGTLTQLFMGFISVSEAQRMNLISGNYELLSEMFSKKNNYINMLIM